MNSTCELSKKKCVPCHGGIPALKGADLSKLLAQLGKEWRIVDEHHLEKDYLFKDFQEGLAFVNRVGVVAEQEGHHPDLCLSYGKVTVQLWTHKINGLAESDFILAAKCDECF